MSDGTLTFDTALDLTSFLDTLTSLTAPLTETLTSALTPLSQTYTPTLAARDLATPVINRVSSALAALNRRTATLTIRARSSAVPLASGMRYVPTDGFPATLHRGEAVLTRAQADLWRAQTPSAAQTATIQQTNHFHIPVQSPDEFAKTMQLYATYGLDGVFRFP